MLCHLVVSPVNRVFLKQNKDYNLLLKRHTCKGGCGKDEDELQRLPAMNLINFCYNIDYSCSRFLDFHANKKKPLREIQQALCKNWYINVK